MKGFLLLLVLATTFAKEPNFIVIFLDDTGIGDLQTYNMSCQTSYQCPIPPTPGFDRMAKEGVKFNNWYSAHQVCSPSRAALLTGRLPIRTGVFPGVFNPASVYGLPAGEKTLPELLKTKDYRTHMVGKWHLGSTPGFLPVDHGFDNWLGIPWSHDYCPCPCNLTLTEDCKCRPELPPCTLYQDRLVVEQPAYLPNLDDMYLSNALAFLNDAKQQPNPYFLYFAFQHTHHPQYISHIMKGRGGKRGAFGDSIVETDLTVNTILDWVRKNDPNAAVFLTSDNGPSLIRHKFGGSAGIYKCGKGTSWDGGYREAGIAWWPGHFPPGETDALASTMDIFPTILNLAGIPVPTDRIIDGVDMTDVLTTGGDSKRDHVWYYLLGSGDLAALRWKEWKAHWKTPPLSDNWMVQPMCGKLVLKAGEKPFLFNLTADPHENDPIDPNSAIYAQVMATMNQMVSEHNCSGKTGKQSPCWNTYGPDKPFKTDKKAEPWPPVPWHPWTPHYHHANHEQSTWSGPATTEQEFLDSFNYM